MMMASPSQTSAKHQYNSQYLVTFSESAAMINTTGCTQTAN
jgi:hypothetical protein